MSADDTQGVLAIWNDIRTGYEPEFESWYKNEHFPERLAVPGFRLGRRYEALAGAPRYFCYYLTDTPDVLVSPAYLERLSNPTPLTRTMMTGAFQSMIRTVCRRALRRGVLWGALSVTARFDGPADQSRHGALVETLAASDGVARCELWTAADQGGVMAEEALRGKDRKIAACLCVDTLRPDDAERVTQQIAQAFGASAEIGTYRLLCEIEAG
jgi:hypothetical protein